MSSHESLKRNRHSSQRFIYHVFSTCKSLLAATAVFFWSCKWLPHRLHAGEFTLVVSVLKHQVRADLSESSRHYDGKVAKGGGKRINQKQQACPRCGNTDHTSANCLRSDKTCRKCGKVGRVDLLELLSPRPRLVRRARGVAKVRMRGESGHMSSQCPKKKVHAVEESTTASQVGSQDTNHGWIGRKLLRCWQRE